MLGYKDLPNKDSLKFFLGLRIKQLRSKYGMTIKELSKLSGLSASYLNEIEKGKKFPKVDKLTQVAKGLKVTINDLLKGESDSSYAPLIAILEKGLLKELPLDIFGLTRQDLLELMAHAPDKFGSLLNTMADLGRSHNLSLKNFQKTALKVYKEKNYNYFDDIEKKVSKIRKSFDLVNQESLTETLEAKYKYKIDLKTIGDHTELSNIRSLYKPGKKPKLLLNPNLHRTQMAFLLAKEIGYCELDISLEERNTHHQSNKTFKSLLDDFRTSYFAGALLLDKDSLTNDLNDWFKSEKFDGTRCFKLIRKYDVSIELFFHRMTQILPKSFGFNDLFFLRYERDGAGNINPSDGLHFSKLHFPHGIGAHEQYCRRWVTISAIDELIESQKSHKFGVQISKNSNGEEYLCLTMARLSNRKADTVVSLTIGINIDEELKKSVNFINDTKIPRKEVGHTCERCPIQDCNERVSAPIIFEDQANKEARLSIISDLLGS